MSIPPVAERKAPRAENTMMVAKMRAQLAEFSEIISKDFFKAKRCRIKEVLYEIQAAKDVKLSNISRPLNGEHNLIKTEGWFSRNVDDVYFIDGTNHQICRLGAPKVLDEMMIAMDLGGIRKRYVKKAEDLGGIYDGGERLRAMAISCSSVSVWRFLNGFLRFPRFSITPQQWALQSILP